MPTTRYVATTGDDTVGNGTQSQPYRTIGKANSVAVSGDTIIVKGDPNGIQVYNETVAPKTGIHYLGDSTYRPVLDSNYTRSAGFYTLSGPSGVTIENFEVRRFTNWGVLCYAQPGNPAGNIVHNNVVKSCHIHHIRSAITSSSTTYSYGCYLVYGNWKVIDTEIHHVLGFNESTGIWMGYCKNHEVSGCTIYSVRKEGIRSYYGNGGWFHDNIVFLSWIGLEANADVGSLWENNYVYHCDGGINPKHTNDSLVVGYWGLTDDSNLPYCRFYHNTIHRCGWAHLIHAINIDPNGTTGYTHKADVRNNIFSGKGGAFFWDAPSARQAPNIVDYNCYSTHGYGPGSGLAPIYMTGYQSGQGQKTLAQLRTDLGFEINGMQVDPQLNDPDHGDLDYPDASPVHNAGADLTTLSNGVGGSHHGTQMGARGLTPHRGVEYTSYNMVRINSSNPPYGGGAVDENLFSNNNQTVDSTHPLWMIFDFGAERTFNHLFTECLTHMATWNPKRFKIEGSHAPDVGGTWDLLADETVYDAGGTGWRVEFPSNPTYRYLRYTGISTFGGTILELDDMRIGFITGQDASGTDPGDTVAPTVSILSPATGGSFIGDIEIDATAADNVGVARVEFYAGTTLIGTVTTPPYNIVWHTTSADSGHVSVTARAIDAAGNSTVSSPVVLTIRTPIEQPPDSELSDFWGVLG